VLDNVPFLFNNPLGKIALQDLSSVDSDNVAIYQVCAGPNDYFSDHDRAIGFENLEGADFYDRNCMKS
jgi:hypothetical protein